MLRRLLLLALVSCWGLVACQGPAKTLAPEVLASYPHDPEAFTQGLVWDAGRLFESTGLNGRSSLREVDLKTGEVLRRLELDERYFAEGLALVENDLYQLTWRLGEAFRYDADTFELKTTYRYDTEGWGLCYDGRDLYMTDGSARLYRRDPESFAVTRTVVVRVQEDGRERAVTNLNELECVGNYVYANVWLSDTIVKIDKASGNVVAVIDASNLLSPEERAGLEEGAVLNGIAYDPEREVFYLTGKLWPKLFEVRFVGK